HAAAGGAGQHAVGTQHHPFDLGRPRQRGKDHATLLGDGLWAVRPARPQLDQVGRGVLAQVVHDELMTGPDQVAGHRVAHVAQADKADIHLMPPCRRAVAAQRTSPGFAVSDITVVYPAAFDAYTTKVTRSPWWDRYRAAATRSGA